MLQRAEDVVEVAYNLLLSRDPDPAGLKHWSSALQSGLPTAGFVRAVLMSGEFRQKMSVPDDLNQYRDVDLIIPVGGSTLRVPASDAQLVPHLLKHRCWEPHVMRYLKATLKPSHVFVDVGANIGYFTILCAPLAGRVIAFEPVATTHDYCKANIALNGLTNVELRQCGLWHEDATLPIRSDWSSVMTAAIAPEGDGTALEQIEVVSLDSLIGDGRLSVSRLDVLKMDVEGSELSALAGMRKTIERFRPRIVMEVNRPALASFGVTVDDVWEFFAGLSYQVAVFEHWQERDPIPVQTAEDLKNLCPPDGLTDIVAADATQHV